MIWGQLIHLSLNMWCDWDAPVFREMGLPHAEALPYLRCEDGAWRDITARMSEVGMNMAVVDVGDGVQFSSHPEISVENAWSQKRLKDELNRLRDLGLEPIPKLNFSACHDVWLGEYSRMVSTERYYQVCRDLITETADLFGGPRFFHIGMDEENAELQKHNLYTVIRSHELWWHDLLLLVDAVKKTGARAWMWADHSWTLGDVYFEKMPKDVLQSNWYYGANFNLRKEQFRWPRVNAYSKLCETGFEQIPCCSNWEGDENIGGTVQHCREHISSDLLQGFLLAPWYPTMEEFKHRHMSALDQLAAAKKEFEEKSRENQS